MDRQQTREFIGDELQRQGAARVGIFGSFARGDDSPDSDIDVLVVFRSAKSLLQLVKIEQDLSDRLGRKVDLITQDSISPLLRPQIEKDLEILRP